MSIKDKPNREHHNVELRSNLSKENNMSAQSSWNMKKTMTVVLATAPLLLAGCGGAEVAVVAALILLHHHHRRHLQRQ